MTEAETSITSRIEQWATRQLADYDAHNPGTLFAEGVVLNVAQGYQLQTAVAQLRQRRGERIVGYKVGCTSPRIRAQLGIDHCVTGRLYDSERHASGAVLSRTEYANLAIEGELAVELSREPTDDDFSGVEVPACVARVVPVIELHNHVLRGEQPSAGELIAHNAIHAGFVAGCGVSRKDARGDPSLAIFADDRLLDECEGPALIQTIRSSLEWLMEIVRDRGDRLSAGQIILTGSIPSLIPIGEDCRIRVDAPPFGSVEVNITA
jgi:2-keto-4-pentenoate hydratase